MPQIRGIDFIRSLKHPPKVIFTTAYRDYAIEAFELNVIDYLLKPISFERFTKSINNFLQHENASLLQPSQNENPPHPNADFIFLKADKKHYKLNLCGILYFESLFIKPVTGSLQLGGRIAKTIAVPFNFTLNSSKKKNRNR